MDVCCHRGCCDNIRTLDADEVLSVMLPCAGALEIQLDLVFVRVVFCALFCVLCVCASVLSVQHVQGRARERSLSWWPAPAFAAWHLHVHCGLCPHHQQRGMIATYDDHHVLPVFFHRLLVFAISVDGSTWPLRYPSEPLIRHSKRCFAFPLFSLSLPLSFLSSLSSLSSCMSPVVCSRLG